MNNLLIVIKKILRYLQSMIYSYLQRNKLANYKVNQYVFPEKLLEGIDTYDLNLSKKSYDSLLA